MNRVRAGSTSISAPNMSGRSLLPGYWIFLWCTVSYHCILTYIYICIHLREELSRLSEEEKDRFEFFSRSHFTRADIKGLTLPLLSSAIRTTRDNQTSESELYQLVISVGTLAKLFVGAYFTF